MIYMLGEIQDKFEHVFHFSVDLIWVKETTDPNDRIQRLRAEEQIPLGINMKDW